MVLSNVFYDPFTETFRKEASSLAFSSSSLTFIGGFSCSIGISDFPRIHKNIVCLELSRSTFAFILIPSLNYKVAVKQFFSNFTGNWFA